MDEQNIQGHSPLHICAIQGNADILQMLLNVTEAPDVTNLTGQSPLYVATSLQNAEIVQLLLIGGCDVDKGDEHRRTSLMVAAEHGFNEIVKILINAGTGIGLTFTVSPPIMTFVICSLVCLYTCSLVAYIANNMNPDQTASLGAV